MASPLLIKMALSYYAMPLDEGYCDDNVDGMNQSCRFHNELAQTGLVRWDQDKAMWRGNDAALRVYAEALQAVPFPVQAWVIPTKSEGYQAARETIRRKRG